MFENLYENVGAKIKGLAKWIFFLEALSAVISGIVLLAEGEAWFGLLTLVLGPVIALASSWLLYAFGQLTEDTHEMKSQAEKIENLEKQVRIIAQPIALETEEKNKRMAEEEAKREAERKAKREEERKARSERNPQTAPAAEKATFAQTEKGTIVCAQCHTEQPAKRRVCWSCGAKFEIE